MPRLRRGCCLQNGAHSRIEKVGKCEPGALAEASHFAQLVPGADGSTGPPCPEPHGLRQMSQLTVDRGEKKIIIINNSTA